MRPQHRLPGRWGRKPHPHVPTLDTRSLSTFPRKYFLSSGKLRIHGSSCLNTTAVLWETFLKYVSGFSSFASPCE